MEFGPSALLGLFGLAALTGDDGVQPQQHHRSNAMQICKTKKKPFIPAV